MILFRANRAYMHQLVEHLPEAWERYILFRWYFAQEAGPLAVGAILRMPLAVGAILRMQSFMPFNILTKETSALYRLYPSPKPCW